MKDNKLIKILKAKTKEEIDAAARDFLSDIGSKKMSLNRSKVTKVTKVRKADNEYVYDIGMKNTKHPWFFANNMLIHNSVYFSAYPIFKEQIERGEIEWNKEKVVELYDSVSDMINDTYPDFMLDTFNVPKSRSTGVIASGREIVATTGLYIKKKRYAALVFDDEGERKDVNGKSGKVKAMGLDLRRADTPVFVQEFLSKLLLKVLEDGTEQDCIDFIIKFKEEFDSLKPWQKGTPKAVNGIVKYAQRIHDRNQMISQNRAVGSITIPGHVQAGLNWNSLRERNHDLHTTHVTDGSKVIVCYLNENNDYKFKSIAYPVEETRLPEWFTRLPFDENIMMEKVVDQKIKNMIGVLKWKLEKTEKQEQHFDSLFEF